MLTHVQTVCTMQALLSPHKREPGFKARDDLSTMDKSPAPNVSTVQGFHCSWKFSSEAKFCQFHYLLTSENFRLNNKNCLFLGHNISPQINEGMRLFIFKLCSKHIG